MNKKIYIILFLFLFLLGCPYYDKDFSLSKEHYLAGWVLHNINETTNTTLDFTDYAEYNYTYNYPYDTPLHYSNYVTWVKPRLIGTSDSLFYSSIEIDVPITKTYYMMGKNYANPEDYTNFSFANWMEINYIESNYDNYYLEWYQEEQYLSEEVFDAINPIPNEKKSISFGGAPYLPTSILVEDGFLKLTNHLLRGKNGDSYIKKRSLLLSDGNYIPRPEYEIREDGVVLEEGYLLDYNNYWDYKSLNVSLTEGIYSVEINIPSGYPIWNLTKITADITYPGLDTSPPELLKVEVSPRFETELNVSINFSDESEIVLEEIYYSTDSNSSWQLVENNIITPAEEDSIINLLLIAEDINGNHIEYEITSVSFREREISFNLNSDSLTVEKGNELIIFGNCEDEFENPCSGLRLSCYINNNFIRNDRIDYRYNPYGEFDFEFDVPLNITGSELNITLVFPGSGIYSEYNETLTFSLEEHDHDLAITNVKIPEYNNKSQGKINLSVYNIGLTDESSIDVNLIIDGVVNSTVNIPSILSNNKKDISFNWTPNYGKTNLTIRITPVSGEERFENNYYTEFIKFGSDIIHELFLENIYNFVNTTNNLSIEYSNEGIINSSEINFTIDFIYDYEYLSSYYVDDDYYIIYNNTRYNITSTNIGDGSVLFNVSSKDGSVESIMYPHQVLKMGDIYFKLNYIYTSSVSFYIGFGSSESYLRPILENGASDEFEFQWIPQNPGYYIIASSSNSDYDSEISNNFDRSNVYVRSIEPDLDFNYFSIPYLPINITTPIEISFRNDGGTTAENNSLIIHNCNQMVYNSISFGITEPLTDEINNFNITIINKSEELFEVTIVGDGFYYNQTNYEGALIEIPENLGVNLRYIYSNSASIYVGNCTNTSYDLPSVDSLESSSYDLPLKPNYLGTNSLFLFLNTSKDNNWEDNYYENEYTVKSNEADLIVSFYASNRFIPVNESNRLRFHIRNDGFQNASEITILFEDNEDVLLNGSLSEFISYLDGNSFFSGTGNNLDNSMQLKNPIQLGSDSELSIKIDYNIESSYDEASLWISNNGYSWDELDSWDGSGFGDKIYNLSSYSGESIYLRFNYESDYSVNYKGFFVDDIKIIDGNTVLFEDTSEDLSNWESDGFTIYTSEDGNSLEPGESIDIEYDWTSSELGVHELTFTVESPDDNQLNYNIVSYSVYVNEYLNSFFTISEFGSIDAINMWWGFGDIEDFNFISSIYSGTFETISKVSNIAAEVAGGNSSEMGIVYGDSLAESSMDITFGYSEFDGNKQIIYASNPSWNYSLIKYLFEIDGSELEDNSEYELFLCDVWDFNGETCTSGWIRAGRTLGNLSGGEAYYDFDFILHRKAEAFGIGYLDRDVDGIPDYLDYDDDGDLFNDTEDNCPLRYNPLQNDVDEDGIGDRCDSDLDGDGILDIYDNFVGKLENIIDKFNLSINNSQNLTRNFTEVQKIEFIKNHVLVEFNFNFSSGQLYLPNITLETQSNESSYGYMVINGINLTEETKTAYIEDINDSIDTLCIKDIEGASVQNVTTNCNATDEVMVYCNGENYSGYICTEEGNFTKVTGLKHSIIVEQEGCSDKDGDGYGVGDVCTGSDCNDADASIYPSAPCTRNCYSDSTYDSSCECSGGTYTCSNTGGTGGSGSSKYVAPLVAPNSTCTPYCDAWGDCIDGKSIRECKAENCNLRIEEKDCEVAKEDNIIATKSNLTGGSQESENKLNNTEFNLDKKTNTGILKSFMVTIFTLFILILISVGGILGYQKYQESATTSNLNSIKLNSLIREFKEQTDKSLKQEVLEKIKASYDSLFLKEKQEFHDEILNLYKDLLPKKEK